MGTSAQFLSHAKLGGCSSPVSPPIFHSKPSIFAPNPIALHSPKTLFPPLHIQPKKPKNFGIVLASDSPSTSSRLRDRWLLQPVGDGDSRHIGFKVEMPDAFEIASSEVTVGRLPEKADMVIQVATGVHARIEKKAGNLVVTDLDSTNGTFIDDKKLRPGVAAPLSSGSCITFGDRHLAMFRVSKIEEVEAASQPQESKDKPAEASSPADETTETT